MPEQAQPAELKKLLTQRAAGLGFDACRVTSPTAPAVELAHHGQWLQAGNAASINYLSRDPAMRYDARSLLPDCRSVIVLALCYYNDDAGSAPAGPMRVARYAWGEDYHTVMREKAEQLGRWLDQVVPQHSWRVTVDSSPLAEKAFAVAAGVGWRGRNTLVVDQRLGSYLVLACLLSNAELVFDNPVESRCGHCRRCIERCPTGALAPPGVLDARRCISYWTTSAKQPPQRAEVLHGWLLGCDVCQQACPYNSAPAATQEPRFTPVPGLPSLQPEELIAMSEQEFGGRFAGTSLAEKGLLRLQATAKLLLGDQ